MGVPKVAIKVAVEFASVGVPKVVIKVAVELASASVAMPIKVAVELVSRGVASLACASALGHHRFSAC